MFEPIGQDGVNLPSVDDSVSPILGRLFRLSIVHTDFRQTRCPISIGMFLLVICGVFIRRFRSVLSLSFPPRSKSLADGAGLSFDDQL